MPVTCTNYKLKCGGCPLLNQPYPDQLKHKQQLEQRLLGRFAPVSPVLGQAEPWHYRNKAIATFATGPRGRLTCGIYAAGTHRVLPYTDCLLQDTVINQTIAAVLEAARACRWPAFEEDRGTGLLRHVLVRRGKTSGQVLVVLVTAQENLPGSRNFVKALREKAPWVTSVVQNCNPRRTSAVLGSDVRTLYGPGKITDTLCGLQFAISPRSFYQVNPEQTEVLYAKAIEFAALTGKETVIDAYCGIGTIGLCAAGRAKQVIGVERNPDAVRNACANAAANKINNARFICADATDWMRAAAQPNSGLPHPDVVFLDPPREGSTPACIDAVAAMKPKRVVYVSCNPETLARDLTHLTRRGWKALKIQPVDMFPHTEHVEQKRAVRSGFDMDILPPDLVTFGKEAEKLLEDLQNHDEKMFMVTILLVHTAPTKQKLENIIYSVNGIANANNCNLIRLDYQQEQGFVSALPLGVNQVEIQRGLTTSGTAIFLPFRSCEVFQPGGLYYGVNTQTKHIILADRKTLKCPNGIVLGTPGSGKSFFAKREMANAFFATNDHILILDPENEYTALTEQLHGQTIYLAPDSHSYLNPMDLDLSTDVGESPMLMQADFLLSQCELMMASYGNPLMPIEKSLIDRCISLVYRDYLKNPRPENMPVLGDLYQCLREQHNSRADDLATAMEIYVTGSLSYLNHRTNVDLNNRMVCYNTSKLGQGLKKLVMSNVQKHIWQRTAVNRYAGITTRIFLDEFHLLLKEPQTAAYTAEIYKRFRKWNGIPTSLTQNVKDLLDSSEIENILENSDFVLMLNQGASDRNILAQRLGISPQELSHVTNSSEGEGLLFFGDKIIPFEDKFPRDTQLYRVMTTKPSDLAA